MEQYLQVGVITGTHGINGEVKVFPTTDDIKRFKKLKQVFLDNGSSKTELKITQVKFVKNMAVLRFEGYDNIEQVMSMKSKGLYVSRENAVKLDENEYFAADLIGIRVISDQGEELGELKDVLQTGANDVYVVEKQGSGQLLLPAIKECIKNVDINEGVMTVYLMPGLRD